MTNTVSPTQNQSALDELIGLINDLDPELITDNEKSEIITDVNKNGISSELRPRLAKLFSNQEELLAEEASDLTKVVESVKREIAGPLTEAEEMERRRFVQDELNGLEQDKVEFKNTEEGIARDILQKLEATPASADAAEAAEIRKNLLSGNNESGTHAPA
jgi:hypothetical protein